MTEKAAAGTSSSVRSDAASVTASTASLKFTVIAVGTIRVVAPAEGVIVVTLNGPAARNRRASSDSTRAAAGAHLAFPRRPALARRDLPESGSTLTCDLRPFAE